MAPRCFVIGHPIAHSRSPLIHGEWLREHRLPGSYERIDVAPAELPAFIARLREGEFAGGNVTVPHKEAVMALVDEISDAGRAVGAVNTLWREGGRIIADNSDVGGFLAHLDATVPGWQDRVDTVLVLGAGGAARGICYGLKSRGVARILVVNRSPERAAELVASWAGDPTAVVGYRTKFTAPVVVPYAEGTQIEVRGRVKSLMADHPLGPRAVVELVVTCAGEQVLSRAQATLALAPAPAPTGDARGPVDRQRDA